MYPFCSTGTYLDRMTQVLVNMEGREGKESPEFFSNMKIKVEDSIFFMLCPNNGPIIKDNFPSSLPSVLLRIYQSSMK